MNNTRVSYLRYRLFDRSLLLSLHPHPNPPTPHTPPRSGVWGVGRSLYAVFMEIEAKVVVG